MKEKMVRITILFLIFILFISLFYSVSMATEVSAYMCAARAVNEAIREYFKKELGIEIKGLDLSCGEITARMKAEKPRFGADMLIPMAITSAYMGKKEGWFEPYPNAPAWKDIDPSFKDPQGYYYDIGFYSFLLIGNKNRLKEKGYEMPKSWKELLDPKWKGEIVSSSPVTSGVAFLINYSFLSLYGEKEGWKFLEALDKNIAQYTKSGNAPTDVIGRGEYTLGITSDEKVKMSIEQGYPIIWTVPAEGVGYEGDPIAILKGTDKLETCKKIINHMGTPKFQKWLSQFSYVNARGYPSGLYGKEKPKLIKIDHAWALENSERIVNQWKDKFLRK